MSYLIIILLALSLLILLKILMGPTVWDRILAFNLFSAKFIMLILLYAIVYEQDYLIDIALVYALLSFINIVFIARFVQRKGNI